MVSGGLLFAWGTLRAGWLPRRWLGVFAAGLGINLVLAFVPAPEIAQTVGSAVRNVGLAGLCWFVFASRSSEE
jgi:hypothetical protein